MIKNNILFSGLICLLLFSKSFAQYGTRDYLRQNSLLSSAKSTMMNMNGFIMVGTLPSASNPTEPDFVIDQTDLSGLFGLGTWTGQYKIINSANCTPGSLVRNYGCVGVDIIETNPGNGIKYAIAGSCKYGVFMAFLDLSGNIVGTVRYFASPNVGGVNDTRPMIRESTTVPGNYYVCGDFAGLMYAYKVNSLGTILFSKIYPAQRPIYPRALIESLNGNDLIIVGRIELNFPLAAEAFFMKLTPGGVVVSTNIYSDGSNGDEWFTSIEHAVSPTGGKGYIIGGRAQSPLLNNVGATPWMIKLDFNGNVIWSSLIRHAIISYPKEIYDVVERENVNTTPTTYEYFCVAHTPTTSDFMTVWKLDEFGLDSFTASEFQYPLGSALSGFGAIPTQIELINSPGAANEGIQVFGTDLSTSPNNNHILTGAYFNGANGCITPDAWTWQQGPGLWGNVIISGIQMNPCLQILISSVPNPVLPGNPCIWQAQIASGSNLRGSTTAIIDNSDNSQSISIYPNPSDKFVSLSFKNEVKGIVKISIINSLGQMEKNLETTSNGGGELILDFEKLQLRDGLYFVNVIIENETYTAKVIYNK